MKNLLWILASSTLLVFWGCADTTETEEDVEQAQEETTEEKSEAAEESDGITTIHSVTFYTSDYDNWRKVYRDATQDENLLGIFEDLNEPDNYMLVESNDGHEKQQEMFESSRFDSMVALSNITINEIDYMNVQFSTNGEGIPYRLGILQEVEDYGIWEEKFWEDKANRNMAGIMAIAIATNNDDPNQVYIWLGVNDIDKAQETINTEKAKRKMDEAGVIRSLDVVWWKPVDELNP